MSGSANKIWITEGPFLQSCQNRSSDFAKDCGEHPRVDKHLPQSPKLLCNDAKDSGKHPKQRRLRHGVACHMTLEIGNYTFEGMLTRIIALEETARRLTVQDIKKAAESVEDTTPAKQSNNDGNGCTEACIVEQLEKKVMEKLGLEGDLFSKDPCFAVFDRSGKKVNLRCKRECKCIVFSKAHKPRMTKEPAETSCLDLCNEGLKDLDEVNLRCPDLPSNDAKDCRKRPWVEKHLPQSPKLLCNDAKDSGKHPKQRRLRHGVACHMTLEIGNYTFEGMLTRIIALEETARRLTVQDIKKAAESVEDTTPAKQSNNDGNGCTEACIVEQLEKKVMEKLGLEGDLFSKDPCFAVFDRSGKKVNLRCERKCKCIVFSKAQNDQEAS